MVYKVCEEACDIQFVESLPVDNNTLNSIMMMTRVAMFLMVFGAALFLSFVKCHPQVGKRDVPGDGLSDDQLKKEVEATAFHAFMIDGEASFHQNGPLSAQDISRIISKHLPNIKSSQAMELAKVRDFS